MVNIRRWLQNLTKFTFQKTYNVIISYGTFHFVEKEKCKEFILAKSNTNVGLTREQPGVEKHLHASNTVVARRGV